jgi:hypothetical protein
MSNKTKDILGAICVIIAIISLLVAVVWSVVFNLMNPDMTELRLFIENPYPTFIVLLSIALFSLGKILLDLK